MEKLGAVWGLLKSYWYEAIAYLFAIGPVAYLIAVAVTIYFMTESRPLNGRSVIKLILIFFIAAALTNELLNSAVYAFKQYRAAH